MDSQTSLGQNYNLVHIFCTNIVYFDWNIMWSFIEERQLLNQLGQEITVMWQLKNSGHRDA